MITLKGCWQNICFIMSLSILFRIWHFSRPNNSFIDQTSREDELWNNCEIINQQINRENKYGENQTNWKYFVSAQMFMPWKMSTETIWNRLNYNELWLDKMLNIIINKIEYIKTSDTVSPSFSTCDDLCTHAHSTTFNVKHCRTEYTIGVPSVRQYGAQPKHWPGSWHTGWAAWLMPDHWWWELWPWRPSPS